jgi:hypothetical protein
MNKPRPHSLVRLCGALAFASAFGACSSAPVATPVATPASAPVAATTLMQQIHAEIGDAACDAEDQCKTVAVGRKACGGPEAYLAWSTKRSDGAKLAQLRAAYAAERQAYNSSSGMASTCLMVTDPGASCSAGHCVTNTPGQGAAAAR